MVRDDSSGSERVFWHEVVENCGEDHMGLAEAQFNRV
jgi:hypothetical protein